MIDANPGQEFFQGEIIREMLLRLEKQEIFDPETLDRLRKLAASGDLKKAESVQRAIQSSFEVKK